MMRRRMKGLQLFIFSAVLVTVHALTVETPVKKVEVARGNNATLPCNFNTEASISTGDVVVWKKIDSVDDAVTRYFDGLVQYGKGYENRVQFTGDVDKGDISITINAAIMEDNGTFTCNVRLRNDPPRQTALMALLVLVAPSKPECKIVGTAEYGQTINLTCISHEGSPKPTYAWQSYDVQNQLRSLQTPEGEQLTLKNISADTSGFYICTSTNRVGKESCNITVSVMPPYCCCCRESKDKDYEMTETEDRNEPSQEKPTRNQRADDDFEGE
ncbi:cell surface A33 antigen isoform X2 [Dromaius novaehollandiae]|uniref:Glycoprotein A33 n=1 Tax=Dromaius novaehollandiae TaxID=8790 RepID=A0A8C4JCM3_DRONO|nr:cell surface A33 antigen isoform X2 [Dromaius novaehollandiae]